MNPIWVGLFNVTGSGDAAILEDNAGAWLWMAAQAKDPVEFASRAAHAMGDLASASWNSKMFREWRMSMHSLTASLN
ncbi:MAG TPA: hypothetical protein VGM27_09310 [Acidobacteriaceae bacterium]|jgi:hypothetical protein